MKPLHMGTHLTESTQQELSIYEYQHDRVDLEVFQKYLHPHALDKSSLRMERLSITGLKLNHLLDAECVSYSLIRM